MAALWLRLLLAVGLPVGALVAVVFLVYRRRTSPRNAPPDLPEVDPAAGAEPAASPGLAKLNMRYSAASGRVGLRFQQLHQHHHHHVLRHRGGGGAQQGPFQWADHPRLVTEAAENGWAQFVFAVAPPRSKSSASSSPLWGTCPVCDAGTSRDMGAEAAAWEVPAGSAERMQAVRLNPATTAASSKKWLLPGSITSPLRGDPAADAAGNNPYALCLARMSLPLPGPPLAGAPFPQDAYFEITIIYLNTKRPEWSASRASRRGRDGAGESDRVKLISFAPDTKDPVQENGAGKQHQEDKQRHLIMSLGLAATAPDPCPLPMPAAGECECATPAAAPARVTSLPTTAPPWSQAQPAATPVRVIFLPSAGAGRRRRAPRPPRRGPTARPLLAAPAAGGAPRASRRAPAT
ncbi:hypothetical protein U9M48_022774 [Paspalum notatum var. saurae]|uniref:Uncharacterized protein n=1 Tax=Paspalum notatum var. saurae TaxID=547442 RepID=A0AAQ3TNU5_PASNO